jgi:uncharacterized membrane protein
MAVRLNEIHPSLVHFPIAVMPVAIGADLIGHLTGSERLNDLGRALMPIAAAGAAISAVTGLIAQEEAQVSGEAADLLVTHRNVNISLTAVSALMAVWRWGRREPGAGYLALGLAGLGAMGYSAYLGGKMVYEHGVGVKPADGLRDGDSPELSLSQAGEAARRAVDDIARGVPHAIDDLRAGRVMPALGHDHENHTATPPGAQGGAGTAARARPAPARRERRSAAASPTAPARPSRSPDRRRPRDAHPVAGARPGTPPGATPAGRAPRPAGDAELRTACAPAHAGAGTRA